MDLRRPRAEVVILVGLPGAGKSTFRAQRLASHHVVSKDLMPRARKQEHQARLIDKALAARDSVVVDNTNVTRAERAAIIAQARAHGAAVVGYFFEPDVRGCLRRNAARQAPARVPDVAVFALARRLQPPTLDEGFDRLHRVRLVDGVGFRVLPQGAG